jgi:hypothetical protein
MLAPPDTSSGFGHLPMTFMALWATGGPRVRDGLFGGTGFSWGGPCSPGTGSKARGERGPSAAPSSFRPAATTSSQPAPATPNYPSLAPNRSRTGQLSRFVHSQIAQTVEGRLPVEFETPRASLRSLPGNMHEDPGLPPVLRSDEDIQDGRAAPSRPTDA